MYRFRGRSGPIQTVVVALVTAGLAAACLPVFLAAAAQGKPFSGEVKAASLSQAGNSLLLKVRTKQRIALRRFDRRPDPTSGRSRHLCFDISRNGASRSTWICLGGKKNTYRRVGILTVKPSGQAVSKKLVAAKVKRFGETGLVARIPPGRAGLTPGRYSWQVSLALKACPELGEEGGCAVTAPPKRRFRYRVRRVQAVGCTGGNGRLVRKGPTGRRRVALTFDDGPGPYTGAVLDTLKKFRVKATFFMLGSQVNTYPAMARRVLREGHEPANHSFTHPQLPGYGEISSATRAIRARTGFRPCLFRPPYGAVSGGLLASVRQGRMKAILWDIDTNDWRLPGSGAIRSAVTGGARPGSIVLMHDAGGPRGQTVAALPGMIRNLKRRGFSLVTVSELLGNRIRYRPVG